MKSISFIFLVIFAALSALPAFAEDAASADGAPAAAEAPALDCSRGPVNKTYGGQPWLVYGCSDDQTLIIVATQDNPAQPFYFRFSPQNNGYHLTGEGTGRHDVTNATFQELKTFGKKDIAALLDATKAKTTN